MFYDPSRNNIQYQEASVGVLGGYEITDRLKREGFFQNILSLGQKSSELMHFPERFATENNKK